MSIKDKIFSDFFEELETNGKIPLKLLNKLKEIKKSNKKINQKTLIKAIQKGIEYVD